MGSRCVKLGFITLTLYIQYIREREYLTLYIYIYVLTALLSVTKKHKESIEQQKHSRNTVSVVVVGRS